MTDIIIIGAGTAGMTAALYALRAGKSVMLLENDAIGGQIASSPKVENFPTIPSISGYDFADKLFDQITSHGADFEPFEAEKVIKEEDGTFTVYAEGEEYHSKAVILACGVKHKTLGFEGEDTLKGISFCAVCDGAFYKDKEVILLGDGNTALQYAILLSNYCSKVYVCTLFDKFFGDGAHVKTLLARDNVVWHKDVYATAYLSENGKDLSGVSFSNFSTKQPAFDIKASACFVAIGQKPNNDKFANLVDLDKMGYIQTGEDMKCKTLGVFAAGDCRAKAVRQLTTAANDGAIAAIGACAYIDSMVE